MGRCLTGGTLPPHCQSGRPGGLSVPQEATTAPRRWQPFSGRCLLPPLPTKLQCQLAKGKIWTGSRSSFFRANKVNLELRDDGSMDGTVHPARQPAIFYTCPSACPSLSHYSGRAALSSYRGAAFFLMSEEVCSLTKLRRHTQSQESLHSSSAVLLLLKASHS